MENSDLTTGDSAVSPFLSLAAMRTAHTRLLKLNRISSSSPNILQEAAAFIMRGSRTGALLDDEDDRAAAQSMLDYWTTILIRAAHEPPDSMLDEFDPELAPELDDSLCPYMGLEAFDESNQSLFFGRRRLVEFLLGKLSERRLLVLVGASGSGKSSAVRAGLIPALRAGELEGSADWRYFPPLLPGSQPLVSLSNLLQRRFSPRYSARSERRVDPLRSVFETLDQEQEDTTNEQRLLADPTYLATTLSTASEQPVLLFVDQFEEIFTLAGNEATQMAFINNLLGLVDTESPRHRVIITMRSDFESFVARVPLLHARFEDARVQLMPLNAAEMREAIERPAAQVGLKFESGVIDALLQDMLGEPAALPLLQFTLLKLWEQRDHNRVTWDAYQRVGGGRQALARSADALYNNLIPEDQVTARRILLRILRPGEGLEITSHRVPRDALYRAGEARDRVDRVLQKLIDARLVRMTASDLLSNTQIEVAHEALVRNWPTLVGWLEDERVSIATRRKLEERALEWIRLGRGMAGLLDKVQLDEAERWLASAEASYLGYDDALPELVAASRAAVQQEEQQRAQAQQRALEQAQALAEARERQAEQAQALAEARARSVQRTRLAATALAIMFLLAAAAAVVAIQSANVAIEARSEAVARAGELATQVIVRQTAEQVAVENAEVASQNAAVARQNADRAATAVAISEVERQQAEVAREQAEIQSRVARSQQLAAQAQTALDDGKPQLGLLLGVAALQVPRPGDPPSDTVLGIVQRLVEEIGGRGIDRHNGAVTGVALSVDGEILVSAGADAALHVRELDDDDNEARILTTAAPVELFAASADARFVITSGSTPGSLQLWDLSSAEGAPRALNGHTGTITSVAMSRNGSRLLTASDDGLTLAWQPGSPGAAPQALSTRSAVRSVALSNDGRWALTGHDDGSARLWNLNDPRPNAQFSIPVRGRITAVTFSPDGRWLAYGTSAGPAYLWQLGAGGFGQGPFVLRATAAVTAITFSGNSALVVTGTADGATRLWDVAAQQDPAPRTVLRGHSRDITDLTASADGTLLVTASADGTGGLWNLTAVDGQVRLWAPRSERPPAESEPAALIERACGVAGRPISEAEWQAYFRGQVYQPICPGAP
ncbi:MAG TPA: WD40 repeat domain-containing protein [Roseiflexaceae bacterium]|nr:WD40 repeat domain-containing protein [Roseiflexaceae bacterium]